MFYAAPAGCGLTRDDGAMGAAMEEARALVKETRDEIQKEMDKPFILRIFGSLFGMEGNSFQNMKERLPKIFSKAMPESFADFSISAPTGELACEQMRLLDGLTYLTERDIAIEQVYWSFDDEINDQYIALPGVILAVEQLDSGGAKIIIQAIHSYTAEAGLGDNLVVRTSNLTNLRTKITDQQSSVVFLSSWLALDTIGDSSEAREAGVPLTQLASLRVTWVDLPGED